MSRMRAERIASALVVVGLVACGAKDDGPASSGETAGLSATDATSESGSGSSEASTSGSASTSDSSATGTGTRGTTGATSTATSATTSTGTATTSASETASGTTGADGLPCDERVSELECESGEPPPEGEFYACEWYDVLFVPDHPQGCAMAAPMQRCVTSPPGGPGSCGQFPCPVDLAIRVWRAVDGGQEVIQHYDPLFGCGPYPLGWQHCGSDQNPVEELACSCPCA